jgi:hypothetical protein
VLIILLLKSVHDLILASTLEKEFMVTTPGFFIQSSTAALMIRLAQTNPMRTIATQKSLSRSLGAETQ